jgi:hypothetical protein
MACLKNFEKFFKTLKRSPACQAFFDIEPKVAEPSSGGYQIRYSI